MEYYGRLGTEYRLGEKLGSGGEGSVWTISSAGKNGLVAKLYNYNRFKTIEERDKLERKVKTMVEMNIPCVIDGALRLAWPQDVLYESGNFIGFVMPRIESTYKIFDICRSDPNLVRDKLYPNYNWKYAVKFAYHFAYLVWYLHSKNIVIGDLNQQNIGVDHKKDVIVIMDCDSFDITDPVTGEHFPCTVGVEEILAPELQVADLHKAKFTKESDNFSLAIHIFRLLMSNNDPFGGVIRDGASLSNLPINKPICNGECAYVRKVDGKTLPRRSPDFAMLPPGIQKLFEKTFNYTAMTARSRIKYRAKPEEWCMQLLPYATPEPNKMLVTCSRNKKHVYPVHNKECPWCEIENRKTVGDVSIPTSPAGKKQTMPQDKNKKIDAARKKKRNAAEVIEEIIVWCVVLVIIFFQLRSCI